MQCSLCENNDNDLGNLNSVVANLPSDIQGILGLSSGITCAVLDDAISSTNSGINDYLLTEDECSDLQDNDNVINLCCPDPLPDTGSQEGDCFSGHSTVHVQGKGEMRIDQLQIGDAVQQLDGSYSTVYSFAHRAPEQIVEYLQIYTTSTKNKALEISQEHMVYANGMLVPAGHVKVGDSLMVRTNNETTTATVTKIGTVSLKGAYAPYTKSGNIVVNGVAASIYVVVEEFNSFLIPSQQHEFQQIINGPHRMLYNLGLLGEETYDNVFGYSQSMMLQRSLKIFLFQYFGHFVVAAIGYLVWKKQKQQQQQQQQARKVADLLDLRNSVATN